VEKTFADSFAAEWIAGWNAHDLNRVLSHYSENFEMSSPYIVEIAGEPSGTLRGKAAVGAYWKKALELVPDLKFELVSVLAGVGSIVLYYKGARGRMVAEILYFGADLKVVRASAHYTG
jgi:ketosteroid isomerase-like protein